jgi:hypothetical protein
VVGLRRWIVPSIGGQLTLERCIHGVAEQFQSGIRPEGNGAFHNQPLLVGGIVRTLHVGRFEGFEEGFTT